MKPWSPFILELKREKFKYKLCMIKPLFEVDTWLYLGKVDLLCCYLYEIPWQQPTLLMRNPFRVYHLLLRRRPTKSKHNTTTQEEEEDFIVQEMQFFNGLALGSLSAFLSKVKKQSIIIFVGAQASKVRLASIPPFKDLVDGKLLWVPSKLH